MKKISLGIDTSCYTTSVVVIDEMNKILYEGRKLLDVKKGTVGLRQSDAFFQHVINLPSLYDACLQVIDPSSIDNVVVSSQPRNVEGSYMPVFLSGLQFAKVISKSLQIPLIELSHQENHLYASAYNHILPASFIGVHISGGTTELLKVEWTKSLNIELICGSLDISFGKLIDRVGHYMGFDFPAGKALDEISFNNSDYKTLKLSIKGNDFNVSGAENQLKKIYDTTGDVALTAKSLFVYISNLLSKVLNKLSKSYHLDTLVLSGGVSANKTIRSMIENNFTGTVIFTDIEFATDHAIGNAYYGSQVRDY